MMAPGSRANGTAASRLRLDVSREAEKPDEKVSRVDRLFDLLGGDGKLKIYRVVEGEDKYACTLDVDDSLVSELEERVAARCGAGEFRLKGFKKDSKGQVQCVASANVSIDELAHPKKLTEAEQKRGEQIAQPVQQQSSTAELIALMEAAATKERQRSEAGRANEVAMFNTMLKMQSDSQAQMLALVQTMHGAAPAAANNDPKKFVTDAISMLTSFGYKAPGTDGAATDRSHMSMTERILEGPLTKIGERIGDRIADISFPAPVPSAPAAASPSPQKNAQQPAPAALPPRPAAAVPPPRARQLTPEELKARLAKRDGTTGAGGPTPAPTVAEAAPEMAVKS